MKPTYKHLFNQYFAIQNCKHTNTHELGSQSQHSQNNNTIINPDQNHIPKQSGQAIRPIKNTYSRFKKHLLTIGLFLYYMLLSYSQDRYTHFERFTTSQGLSQSYVFSIFQDSKGFLWFGTWDGLNRFDGFEFKIFKPDPDNPNSLSNNCVTAIFEDKAKQLWIGTNGGGLNILSRDIVYYPELLPEEKIDDGLTEKPYFIQVKQSHPASNNITALNEDDYGYLWAGTYGNGLNRISRDKNGKFIFTSILTDPANKNSIAGNEISCIYKDKTGNFWVGTHYNGVSHFNPPKNFNTKVSCTNYRSKAGNNNGILSNTITAITEDAEGNIWIGTKAGISILPAKYRGLPAEEIQFIQIIQKPSDPLSLCNNGIETLLSDHTGTIWIGTNNGLSKLITPLNDIQTKDPRFITFRHNPSDINTLCDNSIESMYEDGSGMLWIGTYKGLNKLNITRKPFFIKDIEEGLIDNTINTITTDKKGDLWMGSETGVLTRMSADKIAEAYILRDGAATAIGQPVQEMLRKRNTTPQFPSYMGSIGAFSGNFINSICIDKLGNIWIGGVGLYKMTNGRFQYFHPNPNDPSTISGWAVWSVIADTDGNVWIATSNGLDVFVQSLNTLLHFKNDSTIQTTISSNKVLTLYEDSKGNIWAGTENGLNLIRKSNINFNNLQAIRFVRYMQKPDDPNSLSSNKIWSIIEDRKGIYWIGTEGGGLNKMTVTDFAKADYTSVLFKEKNGLAGNTVYGLVEDNEGNIWISTDKGLSRYSPNENSIRNYYERDGLQSDQFRKGSCFKDKSGTIYFGGVRGVTHFNPEEIKDNPFVPKVAITDFKIFNRPVPVGKNHEGRVILEKPITETKMLLLRHSDEVLTFEFIALHFLSPERNRYAYIMEGFEKKWNYTVASRRLAHYTNLPAGKYTFRVKASNSDGVWAEPGAALQLIIKPPIWLTWYAFIGYLIIFLLILYFIRTITISQERIRTNLKIAQVEAQRKLEEIRKTEEINQQKLSFFTNISHEFRTPLTLIIGPIEDLIKDYASFPTQLQHQLQIIHKNAQHLLRLINQLMDFRKLETGGMSIHVSKRNLISFIESVMAPFNFLAEQRKINFRLESGFDNIEVWFDRDMMEKIVSNLISNAFKFSHDNGEITIKLMRNINFHLLAYQAEYGTRYPEGFVDIIVRDTGIGIPVDKQKKVFDRFYQVETKKPQGGTGIGLSLTKELVELHKGEIMVESKPDEGSIFKVRLPLGNKHITPDQIISVADEPDTGVKMTPDYVAEIQPVDVEEKKMIELYEHAPLILVIEDNSDLRAYIRTSLSPTYLVEEASNGNEGYNKALEIIPDLIISDIMMPDMDGFDLCDKVKKNEKTSHIPVVLLTALATEDSRIKGLELGADDYITKPFSTNVLLARIKNLIESRHSLKSIFSKGLVSVPADFSAFSSDKKFIERAIEMIEIHLTDNNFSVEGFSEQLGLSRAQLYRKLKGLTNQTVSEFIRTIRLKKSAELILEGKLTVNEIMYKVGFNSQSYFTKCFKQQYGVSPSEYTAPLPSPEN